MRIPENYPCPKWDSIQEANQALENASLEAIDNHLYIKVGQDLFTLADVISCVYHFRSYTPFNNREYFLTTKKIASILQNKPAPSFFSLVANIFCCCAWTQECKKEQILTDALESDFDPEYYYMHLAQILQ